MGFPDSSPLIPIDRERVLKWEPRLIGTKWLCQPRASVLDTYSVGVHPRQAEPDLREVEWE